MNELKVPMSIGVGYAFDVIGGLVMGPPRWMSKIGLEWLYRLSIEPKRLWRRYLFEGAIFTALILRAKWRQINKN